MIWIGITLGVLFFICWTLLIGFVAERSGQEKERVRQGDVSDAAPTVYMTFNAEQFQHEMHDVQERLGLLDEQVQTFDEKQKSAPVNLSSGAQRRLELIEPLMERVKVLEDRDETYRDRFTRVERKAGMRV